MSIELFVFAVVLEIVLTVFTLWGYLNEDRIVRFEDKLIRYAIRKWRKFKAHIYTAVRKVFIKLYLPYRKMKIRYCKKILNSYGMKAVRK